MSFYNEWKESIGSEKERQFIRDFLNTINESLETLLSGSKEELVVAVKVLIGTPITKFIDEIDSSKNYKAEDIVQFSNFEHAVNNVCTVIEFSDSLLNFNDLGKKIMHSKLVGACKKYGENHAKLAYEFSFVNLEKKTSTIVTNTSLGSFSISLSKDDKYELIKRLALRNKFISSIIFGAKKDMITYSSFASKVLSESTVNRRKSNVKYLVSLILKDNELLMNIVW